MSKTLRMVITAAALVSVVAGCSDPKAVSKSNFRSALQGYYDTNPECTLASIHEFPQEEQANTGYADKQLKAMVLVGLLKATSYQKAIVPLFSWGKNTKQMTTFVRYELTDTGRKLVVRNKYVGGTELCYAKRHIAAVSSYTEPGDMMGMKVSQVHYTYEIASLEPWTSNPAIQEAFGNIKKVSQDPKGEASATLVLTGDGWKHSAEVR